MGFFSRKKAPPAPEPAAAVVGAVARPLLINPDDAVKVRQAQYRLGAIKRHLEQHEQEGRLVSDQRRQEFEDERAVLRMMLRRAGVTPEA